MIIEPTVAGIPQMGYGTWNRPGDEAYNGVIWALEAGCRHIDTAQGYNNEQDVARGIKDAGVFPVAISSSPPRSNLRTSDRVKSCPR